MTDVLDAPATDAASYPGLDDATALVTGAANGIGRATAAVLSASGATVYGLDVATNSTDGGPAFDAVVEDGELLVADVTDAAAVEAAVETVTAEGNLNAVVNNAGVAGNGALNEVPPETFRETLAVHTEGSANVARVTLDALRAGTGGAMVNLTSIAALGAYAGAADYAAAKGAVVGLTRSLSADYSPESVRINAVAPGFVKTRMNESVWKATDGSVREDFHEHPVMKRTLLPYAGEPADVAHLVAFLCSDAARFITGQVVPVDGGWST